MKHNCNRDFNNRFGKALLLCVVIFFSLVMTVRAEQTVDLDFHYKMCAHGVISHSTERYEYDSSGYGFQIIPTFHVGYSSYWQRDSVTWYYPDDYVWAPPNSYISDNTLIVYKDPPHGPPFEEYPYAFPKNAYYYNCVQPDHQIFLEGGHSYYLTTKGFQHKIDHTPHYPPPLKITRLPQYKCKEGDSSIDLFPSPKLIDTMDVSDIGWSRDYNLTIKCDAGDYFDKGDLYDDPVEFEFTHGIYKYGFRLELNDYIVELYASCSFYPIPVGGTVIPVDKFGLLAPYIGLASTITVATAATAVYVKCIRCGKKKGE